MSAEESVGFQVTPKRIGFVLSVVAIVTVFWNGAAAWNTQAIAVETTNKTVESLQTEIKDLSRAVTDLAIAVKGLEVKTAL